MNITILADSSSSLSGTGTATFTAPFARSFKFEVESTLTPPSGLQIVINLNGSAVVTQAISSSTAMTTGASAQIACAASDVVTIVISSSVQNDIILNNVKSNILVKTLSF